MENEIDIKVRAELQERWGNASALMIDESVCSARFDATGHNGNTDMIETQDYLRVICSMNHDVFVKALGLAFAAEATIENMIDIASKYMYQEYTRLINSQD